MIYIKLYLKKPEYTFDIIKTRILSDDELLVWSKITMIEKGIFTNKKTEYYYYSTVEGIYPIKTINVNTLETPPDHHLDMIGNYFYGEEFKSFMFDLQPKFKAKVINLELVK